MGRFASGVLLFRVSPAGVDSSRGSGAHPTLEIWARICPTISENRAALVGAEIARIDASMLTRLRLTTRPSAGSRKLLITMRRLDQ